VKRTIRSIIVAFISISLIFLPLANASAGDESASAVIDLIAPEISSPNIAQELYTDEPANIQAMVTDNEGVKSVTLFYRNIGASDFKSAEMERSTETDIYSIKLTDISEPGVEYYIQATDLSGNAISHGHSIAPLTITILLETLPQSDDVAVASANPEDLPQNGLDLEEGSAEKSGGISKWVWIGLGVLLVGAAAGGGGGGGTTAATTGTVTITGTNPQ